MRRMIPFARNSSQASDEYACFVIEKTTHLKSSNLLRTLNRARSHPPHSRDPRPGVAASQYSLRPRMPAEVVEAVGIPYGDVDASWSESDHTFRVW